MPRRNPTFAYSIIFTAALSFLLYFAFYPLAPITENVSNDKIGRKVFMLPWAVGSRDHIIYLSTPVSYIPMIGAFFKRVYGQELPATKGRDPFLNQQIFEMELLTMEGTVGKHLPKTEYDQKLRVSLDSIFAGSKVRNEAEQLQMLLNTQKTFMRSVSFSARNFIEKHPISEYERFELRLEPRPPRYGLSRLGPIHDFDPMLLQSNPSIQNAGFNDLYYSGTLPETSEDFLLCSDDAVPDERPDFGRIATCSQWFAIPELSATVKVSYKRRHLSEWRDIKAKVSELLISWKTDSPPSPATK